VIDMSHLEDRLAEFVYEELPASEMEDARRHVGQCPECQARVSDFEKIRHTLEELPDVEIPRRVVFVPSNDSVWSNFLSPRWLVPMATAAALVLALVLVGPIDVDWQESGVVIAFGEVVSPPASVPVARQPAITEPQTIDYERIVTELEERQQAWLESELVRRVAAIDAANRQEIQRVRANLVYLSDLQRAAGRDTMENSSSIQLLAARTGVQE
jgi:hypothetical protein